MSIDIPFPSALDADSVVARITAGDEKAFAQLIDHFGSRLRSWLAVRCPAGVDPDDIAQQTFLEIYRNIDRYRPGSSLATWIFTVARYQLLAAISQSRRDQAHRTRHTPDLVRMEIERRHDDDDEDSNQAAERLQRLRHCLEQLSVPGRQLIEAHYVSGQSLADIVGLTGRSLVAIKQALFKSRRALHRCIDGQELVEPS